MKSKYRNALPQLNGDLFLADGGMGTTLIFHEGLELPHFCTFPLMADASGRTILANYFQDYTALAQELETGFILDSGPTWRASADWGKKLGFSVEQLADINHRAIDFMCELREGFESERAPVVVSGCLGPRGDGYQPGEMMSAAMAEEYHAAQINTFSTAGADLVTAMTLTYADEAVGIVRAAQAAEIPVVISFTVETDGRLPTGQSLRDAIHFVEDATAGVPAYYMINCAHPTHFADVLEPGSDWTDRIQGIRLNASCASHAELDEALELDDGNPIELGVQVAEICRNLPRINVVGGCCGTDYRHIREIATNMLALVRH